jgi:hypothetical protein
VDTVVTICAITSLALAAIGLIGGPFRIGTRSIFTARTYIFGLIEVFCIVVLAGRALGWW